jgi:hypothetical protein
MGREIAVPAGSAARSNEAVSLELPRTLLNNPGETRDLLNRYNKYNLFIRLSKGDDWYKELLRPCKDRKMDTCVTCKSWLCWVSNLCMRLTHPCNGFQANASLMMVHWPICAIHRR